MDIMSICVDPLPQAVVDWCEKNSISTAHHFCAYLEYIDGEMVERVFGTRRYKKHGVRISEVMRHSTGASNVIVKNLLYRHMNGYSVVYEPQDVYDRSSGYGVKVFYQEDFDVWYAATGNIGMSYVYVNPEYVTTVDEFKYCGYSSGGVVGYLNAYRKDKSIEIFGKMGLGVSPILMRKAKKDKAFRKWLYENHNGVALYGVQAALHAYKTGKTVEEARNYCYFKNQFDRMVAQRIPEIRGTTLDRERVLDYVDTNDIDYTQYDDYLKAVKGLKLDLKDTKNIYPRDFARMHDLRAAEYASEMAKADKERRKKLYEDFSHKAKELQKYSFEGELYSIIIPHSVADLINEGTKLQHCVGKMGYDKKVVDGVSLIAFVRKNGEIEKPFVTAEYRFDEKKLRQCYGIKDSKPADEVLAFVNTWAENVRKEAIHNG